MVCLRAGVMGSSVHLLQHHLIDQEYVRLVGDFRWLESSFWDPFSAFDIFGLWKPSQTDYSNLKVVFFGGNPAWRYCCRKVSWLNKNRFVRSTRWRQTFDGEWLGVYRWVWYDVHVWCHQHRELDCTAVTLHGQAGPSWSRAPAVYPSSWQPAWQRLFLWCMWQLLCTSSWPVPSPR